MQRKYHEKLMIPFLCVYLVVIVLIFAYTKQKELAFYESVLKSNGSSTGVQDVPNTDSAENEQDAYDLYVKMNQAMRDVSRVEIQAFYEITAGPEYGDDAGSTYGTFTIRQIQRSDTDIDMEMDGNIRFENGVKHMLNYYSSGEYTFKDKSQDDRMGMPMDVTAIPLQPVNPQFEEKLGYGGDVEEAENGLVAIEKFKAFSPDLVMLDITMPKLDGIDALREIKQLDPNAKVVMCSAMGQDAMVMEAIKFGAVDFIVKPFKADRIEKMMKAMFG